MKARFRWRVKCAAGTFELENLAVDTGLDWLAGRIGGTIADEDIWLAVGTDSTPAAAGQTTLGAEVKRVAASIAVGTAKVTYTASTALASSVTLRELGSFDAASSGNMISRAIFADKLISPADLDIDLELQVTLEGSAP
jgi:hypothetical protein